MSRLAISATLALGIAIAVVGCAPADTSAAGLTASCNVARAQLAAIGALIDSPSTSDGAEEDQPLDVVRADAINDDADRLAAKLADTQLAADFVPVREALKDFADDVAAEPNSAEAVAAARARIDTAGTAIVAQCPIGGAGSAVNTAASKSQIDQPVGSWDSLKGFSPALAPGQSAAVDITRVNDADDVIGGRLEVSVARVNANIFTSWGRDYVIRIHAPAKGNFTFLDESGDKYTVQVMGRLDSEHTVYYDSDAPALVKVLFS